VICASWLRIPQHNPHFHQKLESRMATIRREIVTAARADVVWDALRDVGALHTRLVPGFVTATRLEPGARVVTFDNGLVVRETIITVDDSERRIVWSASGGSLTHHNASVQVFQDPHGTAKVAWIADILPDAAAGAIAAMIDRAMATMKRTLDGLAAEGGRMKSEGMAANA
jgi:Polyketide cyclase / dehydrase and lipid transport